jgi:hypothetical protein
MVFYQNMMSFVSVGCPNDQLIYTYVDRHVVRTTFGWDIYVVSKLLRTVTTQLTPIS